MKNILLFLIYSTFLLLSCNNSSSKSLENKVALWPKIEPFKTEYLKVSDIHDVYYELSGNPNGKPVITVHGGPGSGISSLMPRFFNPDKFLIISFDQRGCGKSKPLGEIEENTTWDLVEDIENLRKHLGLKKIHIFAGSWGSTLSIAYAEKYPENVNGMLLYGIYLGTKQEDEHIFWGARKFFPDAHDRLITSMPEINRHLGPRYLLESVVLGDSITSRNYSRIYDEYCYKISKLEISDETIQSSYSDYNPYIQVLIEGHYTMNSCFLEDNQLLNNAQKMANIPITILNGRYDMICPPITAYSLHETLPLSKLIIVEKAGHSRTDEYLQKALVIAAKDFE